MPASMRVVTPPPGTDGAARAALPDANPPAPRAVPPAPHASACDTADHAGLVALNLVRQPVWIFDIDRQRVHWANVAALAVWQADSLQALCARDMGRDMSASVAARLAQYQADFVSHQATFNEQWTIYPAGKPVSLTVHYSGYPLPDGRMAMVCEARPVDAATPDSLRSVEALLHTPVMISLYSLDGTPLYRNPAARTAVRSHDERLAQRFASADACARLMHTLAVAGQATLTMPVHTAAGQRWHEVSASQRLDAATGDAAVLLSEVDVTPLKESEAHARYLSMHDPLTGLPNRSHIRQRFIDTALPLRGTPRQAALVLIDLDHFKDINDSLGHAAGDELLVEVGGRLRRSVRRSDLVARFGGDEFLILLQADDIRSEVHRIDQRIRSVVAQPVVVAGTQVHVSATVGVSLFPDDGDDFESLLQHADLAMYSAKAGGRNALAFYEAGMATSLRTRTGLETDLRVALDRRQFELHYQPRVCMDTGRIHGAEALVRWRHPLRGLVPPNDFIAVCESSGLIRELGRQVFDMAAHQQALWTSLGHGLKVSVNLSPREFDDDGLLADLRRTLDVTRCPPQALQMEVTESMLMGSDDRPLRTLQGMRELGLSIALDDFGTGYSNLAYLQRFPFSTLKIDRAFVQAAIGERPLAEAIVGLCHVLKLQAVAEGVETDEQRDWLRTLGVAEYQGFLFSRPLPVPQFEALLARVGSVGGTDRRR